MGEIKSTMDLVMEKTRHLSLNREEKKELKQNELRKKLRGLLQKYEGEVLDIENFRKELSALQNSYKIAAKKTLKDEIWNRLTLDNNHADLLKLLQVLCEVNTKSIENIKNEYQNKVSQVSLKRAEQIKALLSERHHISGSAVMPNIEADDQLERDIRSIQAEYRRIFEDEKAKL